MEQLIVNLERSIQMLDPFDSNSQPVSEAHLPGESSWRKESLAVSIKRASVNQGRVSDSPVQVPYEAARHWGWHQGRTECFLCFSRCPGRRQAFPNLSENQPGTQSQLTALDHNFWEVTKKKRERERDCGDTKSSLQSYWDRWHISSQPWSQKL